MPYTAAINRENPGCVLFVIDQSASMQTEFGDGTRAERVATVLNDILASFIIRCNYNEGIRDYFDIGVIGYGRGAGNAFTGTLGERILNPVSLIEENAKPVLAPFPGGVARPVTAEIRTRKWFEPRTGGQTPMCEAFRLAAATLVRWCDSHMDSFPPVVIHLSDGGPTDGDPRPIAQQLHRIGTKDGETVLMNIHISSEGSRPIKFPVSGESVETGYARTLFEMSSVMPESMREQAKEHRYHLAPGARAFMYNAGFEQVVEFFDIGTRVGYPR